MSGLVGSRDTVDASGAARGNGAPEHGLFVVWAQARRDETEILADLARRFELIQAYEIRWTPGLVRRNYERFYSDLEVRGVYHEINKGTGAFVAATLIDPHPVHEVRQTSRGPRVVNTNFHDAKLEYRDRSGDLGLHCSETVAETRRDLVMLLGLDVCEFDDDVAPEPWDGQIERIEVDVAGADGWDSESDLLRALNASVEYVVLGAPTDAAGSLFGGPQDPQLLTTDCHSLHTVLNAQPCFGQPPTGGGRFTVRVGGRRVPVGIRSVGDGYIDSNWARHCLEHRVLDERRFFRPSETDDLATQCYLALTRRRHLTDDDQRLIETLANQECEGPEFASTHPIGRTEAIEVVRCHLSTRGYECVVPHDPTVPHHVSANRLDHVARAGRGTLAVLTRGTGGVLRTRWLAARDALVVRAPTLRTLVRRWSGDS